MPCMAVQLQTIAGVLDQLTDQKMDGSTRSSRSSNSSSFGCFGNLREHRGVSRAQEKQQQQQQTPLYGQDQLGQAGLASPAFVLEAGRDSGSVFMQQAHLEHSQVELPCDEAQQQTARILINSDQSLEVAFLPEAGNGKRTNGNQYWIVVWGKM